MPRAAKANMRIQYKLFLIILTTCLLLVGGMFGFVRWSLTDGFNAYLERRESQRARNLVENLRACYARHADWDELQFDRRHWLELLWTANHRGNMPSEFERLGETIDPEWPPRRLPGSGYGSNDLHFELRAMLLNDARRVIVGREDLLEKTELFPIVLNTRVVGYLAILKINRKLDANDLSFFDQQRRAFTWITLGMLILSFLVASTLTYWLSKPLKHISDVVRQLASGDYEPRVRLGTRDALGGLAMDINHLALILDQTEQSRRHWIADVSHELRTPLSVLRAELEALQDGVRPLEVGAIDLLLNEVLRLTRLTDDLYQLALSDRHAMNYDYRHTEPLSILETLLKASKAEFDSKSLKLELVLPWAERVKIWADPDRLAQLFSNLLTNSLRYTDAGGCLRICGHVDSGRLRLEFADSSPGVANSDLNKLFQRFYRVETSRSRNHGGAGLGLAICQSIVEAHGGEIEASTSDLGGLRVSLALPLL